MTQTEKKLRVKGFFGEKEVTREEFVAQWRQTTSETIWLADTKEDHDAVLAFRERVIAMANAKFDRCMERQERGE